MCIRDSNVSRANAKNLLALVDDLEARFAGTRLFSVYCAMTSEFDAVSYTHLDVYKRQGISSACAKRSPPTRRRATPSPSSAPSSPRRLPSAATTPPMTSTFSPSPPCGRKCSRRPECEQGRRCVRCDAAGCARVGARGCRGHALGRALATSERFSELSIRCCLRRPGEMPVLRGVSGRLGLRNRSEVAGGVRGSRE